MLGEAIHEALGFLIFYAESAHAFAGAADDQGLEYSIKQIIARAKSARLSPPSEISAASVFDEASNA
jgi:hypothetical protein